MYRLCMDKTRKIRSQNVRKFDLKDTKDVGKVHSAKTKENLVCYSTEGEIYLIII